ncbi:sterol desaturase family protein [Paraburkholderia kururiensis]|uniref:sterol desaturase family protein n=1 Tax=Paraburkholderia kururiensis TaxID=984307 RepID=UPI000F87CBF5|nr:sterol desaturase family protein [Paraburkholderia kururiensis]
MSNGFSADAAHWLAALPADFLASLATAGAVLGVAMAIEARVPHAQAASAKHAWFNVRYMIAMLAALALLRPFALGVSLALTRALGGGWVTFREGVVGWCEAFAAVLLMTDLLEYLFHRAQHRFAVLWRMHELHHSAPHYDVTLGYRHFWLEPVIKTALLYPLVGIVFKAPTSVGMAVGMVFLVNHHVAHLNLRFSPRRFGLVVSHPQYHRLHHSRHAADYNRNFCDLLPLWDMVFGTLRRPRPDEFVEIGLDSLAAPQSIADALLWPWRRESYASRALCDSGEAGDSVDSAASAVPAVAALLERR